MTQPTLYYIISLFTTLQYIISRVRLPITIILMTNVEIK